MKEFFKRVYSNIFCRKSQYKYYGKNIKMSCSINVSNRKFISIGNNTHIFHNTSLYPIVAHAGLTYKPSLEIGNDVHIGSSVILSPAEKIYIGDRCVLSDNIFMCDTEHGFDPNAGDIIKQPNKIPKPIIINHDTFIGRNVFVAPGVELGHNCIVGANSVVTKSFPAYSMVAGSPAKIIKVYSFEASDWIRYVND
jgi:lipopolysaccharide O-acetyltransferase